MPFPTLDLFAPIIEILRETPSFRAGRKGGGPCGATAEPSGGVEAPAFRPGRTSTPVDAARLFRGLDTLAVHDRRRGGGAAQCLMDPLPDPVQTPLAKGRIGGLPRRIL